VDVVRAKTGYRARIMDFLIGALFAAFVIVVSTFAGRSLDRAKQRAAEGAKHGSSDLYGDF